MAGVFVVHWFGCADEYGYACEECQKKVRAEHPLDCEDEECSLCGMRDCPSGDETHYWHDGCAECTKTEGHE